jgi:hypothetical protein
MPEILVAHFVFDGVPRHVTQIFHFLYFCYSSVCSIYGPILGTLQEYRYCHHVKKFKHYIISSFLKAFPIMLQIV